MKADQEIATQADLTIRLVLGLGLDLNNERRLPAPFIILVAERWLSEVEPVAERSRSNRNACFDFAQQAVASELNFFLFCG
jgi:hypothetical protein